MTNKKRLEQLTIDEKIKFTAGNSMWTVLGHKELFDTMVLADGPHGIRAYKENPSSQMWDNQDLAPSTLFPSATAMASTFNEDLVNTIGQTIAKECNHYEVDVLLAPGVNLKRSPLAGRNFEYYSEDPYLTSRMAINFINGVQHEGVGACIKHFALNEQEDQRRFINSIVDERTLHEFYLRPFYNAIKEANPVSIMSSYNKINGHYASESSFLLKDILRDKWGYKGCVISDWGAVQNKVKSLKTGMNLEMPGGSEFTSEVYEALENNTLTEQEIDASLIPLFDLYDYTRKNNNKGKKVDFKAHHEIAYEVTKEAIVLLKNDGILPLKQQSKIGVVGQFAETPRINGGGSASLLPFCTEKPLDELRNYFTVDYAKGYTEEDTTDTLLEEVRDVCKKNDTIIYFTGTTEKIETEGKERLNMNIPEGHIEVINEIKKHNKNVIVVLSNGGVLDLTPVQDCNAIIEAWFLGSSNGKALSEIIAGIVNPSGRLSETIPLCIEHTPHYKNFPSKQDEVYYMNDILNVGYRYYDTHNYPVRYPFGYGLSYTSFSYDTMTLSSDTLDDTSSVTVSVDVTNTGTVVGKETVQLYISDRDSYYPMPRKELKQFTKIELQPNETKTVTFTLTKKDFAIYSVDHKDFEVEGGFFEILIGKNVSDICLKQQVLYKKEGLIRTSLTLDHTLKTFAIYKHEAYLKIETTYRTFPWYEIEQPAIRVLKRLQREFDISKETLELLKKELLQ